MKDLHFTIIIVASIAFLVIASTYIIFNPIIKPTCLGGPGMCGHQDISQEMVQINNTSPKISTIAIPKDSEDASSGKNYEPQYLVVVIGVNNTVRWINQAVIGNTVVADNYDDPDFSNVTKSQSEGYMHIQLTNFLDPGSSFNFTFTKVGEFGYHGEPHPWLRGWVLVLPQSTVNATQTVVLNDSGNIPNPCGVFAIPCPLNPSHTFSAQKLGSNIYIEKFTGNGVDYYAIIHNFKVCTFSTNFGGSCSNPDDLAILRFIGADMSVPRQETNISITGLRSQYSLGEPIDFGIHIQGYGPCDFPSVSVMHGTSVVWKSKQGVVSCPSPLLRLSEIYDLGSLGGPFYLNQTGTYTVQVGYNSNSTEKEFDVIQSNRQLLEKIPVIINGVNSDFSFNYTVTGGQIEQAKADIPNKAVIISMKTTGNGILIAYLPRALIDAKINGQDTQFVVLEDGTEVLYEQIMTTSTDRVLSIPFQYGVSQISIIAPQLIR